MAKWLTPIFLLLGAFFMLSLAHALSLADLTHELSSSDLNNSNNFTRYRILYASPYSVHTSHVTKSTVTITYNETQTVTHEVEYGQFSLFFSLPADPGIITITFGTTSTPTLQILPNPNTDYTLVLFDNDPFAQISQYWDYVSSAYPGNVVIAVLNHRDYLSDTNGQEDNAHIIQHLPLDTNLYRFVNLVKPSTLPDVENPQTDLKNQTMFALLYKSKECYNCNYCVLINHLDSTRLSYTDGDAFNYIIPPKHDEPGTVPLPSQITLFKKIDHLEFTFNLALITPINIFTFKEAGIDDNKDYIIYGCNYPENQQAYYIHKLPTTHSSNVQITDEIPRNYIFPIDVHASTYTPSINDPLRQYQQHTFFLIPPLPVGKYDNHIVFSDISMVHHLEQKGSTSSIPLIVVSTVVLVLLIITTFIIRVAQRSAIKHKLDLEFQQKQVSINSNPQIYTPPEHQKMGIAQPTPFGGGNTPVFRSRGSPSPSSHSSAFNPGPTTTTPQIPKLPKKPSPPRLQSLDVFRGAVICAMVFCNTGGGGFHFMDHAAWDGFYFPADLIFPGFVFIMGVSNTLSIRSNKKVTKFAMFQDIALRALKLFTIGLFLANVGKYKTFRIFGILQRFGIAYLAISLLKMLPVYDISDKPRVGDVQHKEQILTSSLGQSFLQDDSVLLNNALLGKNTSFSSSDRIHRPREGQGLLRSAFQLIYRHEFLQFWAQWVVVLTIIIIWASIFLFVPAGGECPAGYAGPGGPFVSNGRFAHVKMDGQLFMCTGGINGYIDRLILTFNHMFSHPTPQEIYRTEHYDPEGVFGTLMTIICAFLGMVVGRVLSSSKLLDDEIHGHSKSNISTQVTHPRSLHLLRAITWCIWSFSMFALTLLITQRGYPWGLSFFDPNNNISGDHNHTVPFLFGINKNLWTFSFVTFTVSILCFLFAMTYVAVDGISSSSNIYLDHELWGFTTFLKNVGLNSLMFFILPNVLATKYPFTWVIYGRSTHWEATLQSWHAVLWVIGLGAYCAHHKIVWKV